MNRVSEIKLIVTETNWTTIKATGIPYQTLNGNWRLRFNIDGILSVADQYFDVTIAGITFDATCKQAVTLSTDSSAPSAAAHCHTSPNTSNIDVGLSAAKTLFYLSGDVSLKQKPTWLE